MPNLPSMEARSLPSLSDILRLEPGDSRCLGIAPSKGRRCLKITSSVSQNDTKDLLDLGTSDLYAGRSIDTTLERIAQTMLCNIHKSQVSALVSCWKENAQPYAQIWQRPSIRSERQPFIPNYSVSVDRRSILRLSDIIKLDIEKTQTCAGYARSRGRPCLIQMGNQNMAHAMNYLNARTTALRLRQPIDWILESLGSYTLCKFHKSQKPDLVARWKARLITFTYHPSIPMVNRQGSLDPQLEVFSESENASLADNLIQTPQSTEEEASQVLLNVGSGNISVSEEDSILSDGTSEARNCP